jgi:hypothetical protein
MPPPAQRRRARRPSFAGKVLAMLALLPTIAALFGCGAPSRSVASYCSYLYGEGGKLRGRWEHAAASQDPLGALGTIFSVPQELADFFHQLSLRAPDAIVVDVEGLAQSYQRVADQQGQNAGNPLAGLASGLVTGLSSVRAERHFNYYSLQHCGRPH